MGTEPQLRRLEGLVKAILVLNLLDAVFTLVWVRSGAAVEKNRLLAELIDHYPVVFVLVKFALVSFGSYLLWRYRHRASAVIGLFLIFLAYYFLLLYHLWNSSVLIRSVFH